MKFVEIVKKTNIDFIGLRNKAFILSLVFVVLGCIGFVMVSLGKANLSVDFDGRDAASGQIQREDIHRGLERHPDRERPS